MLCQCSCGRECGVCEGGMCLCGAGYCYLNWFRQIEVYGYVVDLRTVRLMFGPYPRVVSVLGYMYACGYDVSLQDVELVGPGLLHVDSSARLVRLVDLIVRFFGSNARVGADDMQVFNDRVRMVEALVKTSGLNMSSVMAECAQQTLKEAVGDPRSVVSEVLKAQSVCVSEKEKFYIPYVLDSSELGALQRDYPGLNVFMTGKSAHPHAFAAAARMCAEEQMLRDLGYNKSMKGVACVDIGANPVRHVACGRMNVHCCVPIIDVRDSARETERMMMLQKMVADRRISRSTVSRYVSESNMRCKKLGQECSVKAPLCVFLHSLYDMSWSDLGAALQSHGTKVAMGVVMFDPMVLVKDVGVIDGLNAVFRVSEGKIRFQFAGDSSLGYCHDYSTYVRLLTESVIVSPCGWLYTVQRVCVRSGQLFLKFVRCIERPRLNGVEMSFSYWMPRCDDVVVSTWVYDDSPFLDSKFRVSGVPPRVKRRFIVASRRLYDLVLSHCLRSGDKSFNLNEIFSCSTSYNSRMTLNGVDVRVPERMDPELLMDLVVAVFCISFRTRWQAGKMVECFVSEQKKMRAKSSLGLVDVMSYVWSKLGCDKLGSVKILWNRFVDSVSENKKKKYLDVKMFESVKCMTFTEIMDVTAKYGSCMDECVKDLDNINISSVDVTEGVGGECVLQAVSARLGVTARLVEAEGLIDDSGADVHRGKMFFPDARGASRSEVSARMYKRSVNEFVKKTSKRDDLLVCRERVRALKAGATCNLRKLREVPGDGHCFFHALKYHFSVLKDMDVCVFRRLLYVCASEADRKNFPEMVDCSGSREAWGNSDMLTWFSGVFGVRVCVHGLVNGVSFESDCFSADGATSGCIHLNWVMNGADGHVRVIESGVDLSDRLPVVLASHGVDLLDTERRECLNVQCMLLVAVLGCDRWRYDFDSVIPVVSDSTSKVFYYERMDDDLDLDGCESLVVRLRSVLDVNLRILSEFGAYQIFCDRSVSDVGVILLCMERLNKIDYVKKKNFVSVSELLGLWMGAYFSTSDGYASRVRKLIGEVNGTFRNFFSERFDARCMNGIADRFERLCGLFCDGAVIEWMRARMPGVGRVVGESVVSVAGAAMRLFSVPVSADRHAEMVTPGKVVEKGKWKSRVSSYFGDVGSGSVYGVKGVSDMSTTGLMIVNGADKTINVRMKKRRSVVVPRSPLFPVFEEERCSSSDTGVVPYSMVSDVRVDESSCVVEYTVCRERVPCVGRSVACMTDMVVEEFLEDSIGSDDGCKLLDECTDVDIYGMRLDDGSNELQVDGVSVDRDVVEVVMDEGNDCSESECFRAEVSLSSAYLGVSVDDHESVLSDRDETNTVFGVISDVSSDCTNVSVVDKCKSGFLSFLKRKKCKPRVDESFIKEKKKYLNVGRTVDYCLLDCCWPTANVVSGMSRVIPTFWTAMSECVTSVAFEFLKVDKSVVYNSGCFNLKSSKVKFYRRLQSVVSLPDWLHDCEVRYARLVKTTGKDRVVNSCDCFYVFVESDRYLSVVESCLKGLNDACKIRNVCYGLGLVDVSDLTLLSWMTRNESLHARVFYLRNESPKALMSLKFGCKFDVECCNKKEVVITKKVGLRRAFPRLDDCEMEGFSDVPRVRGNAFHDRYVNCMLEFKYVCANADRVLRYEMHDDYVRFVGKSLTVDENGCLRRNGMNIFDCVLKKWLFPLGKNVYMNGYDGQRFCKYDCENDCFSTGERYVLCSRRTKVMLNTDITRSLDRIALDDVLPPKFVWVNGVPGCGKTTYIVSEHIAGRDLVVSPTLEGIASIRARSGVVNDRVLRECYRTIASVLVNGLKNEYERVFVDEALMVHIGAIAYVCMLSKCKEVWLIGDRNQIPFIDRDHVCEILFSSPALLCDVSKELNVTYRCPVDVAYCLKGFYPDIGSKSEVIKSVSRMYDVNDIPVVDGALYLTHLQGDKEVLLNRGFGRNGSRVLTVNEAQGLTFKHVVCVRLQTKPVDIFESDSFAIVAISRHTVSFVYCSAVSDALTRLMGVCDDVCDSDLLSWNILRVGLKGGYCVNEEVKGLCVESVLTYDFECEPWGSSDIVRGLPTVSSGAVCLKKKKCDKCVNEYAGFLNFVPVVPDGDISHLQEFYDDKMPGISSVFLSEDQCMVEYGDISVNVGRMDIVPGRGVYRPARFDRLRPVLHTIMSKRRIPSQKESVLGLIKRNLNVPKLCNAYDPRLIARLLKKNFLKSALSVDGRMIVMNEYSKDVLGINECMIAEWLETQKPGVAKLCRSDVPMHERRTNVFKFMIKSSVKPGLEVKCVNTYPSVQTIAYSDKDVNVMFCPVFKRLRKRLMSVLKEKVKFFCDMSVDEFERELNLVNRSGLSGGVHVEIDFSKYDKSQAAAILECECMLYEMLGMDSDLLSVWKNSHVNSRVMDVKNGVRVETMYQRKSGDASTYFGNTLVLLSVLLSVYDIDIIEMILVSGDDSVIFFKRGFDPDYDPSGVLADLFNLECKLLRKYNVPYFCSKFLVEVEGRLVVVPDPVKVVAKLGRLDMSDWVHVEEYRVSCIDAWKCFSNELIVQRLSEGVFERYGGMIDCSKVCRVLTSLIKSECRFKRLFEQEDWMVLCKDPSARKSD